MRYKFICEYNGSAFSGWQEQLKNGIICEKTVQSELERAFSIALRQKIGIVGAGRTDAGVHAKGQVAHFDHDVPFDCRILERSVNAISDENVCIRHLEPCSSDFHARYSAKERYYAYSIYTEPVVLGREQAWICGYKLNTELMEQEAKNFLDTHDFKAFSIPRNDGKSTVCTITAFFLEKNASLLRWNIRGDRFLHKQVRSMIGLLFDVGRGRLELGVVAQIFSGEFKMERMWAPPHGLTLEAVWY
jgi:tRNA pseudouridine38-40 synthase